MFILLLRKAKMDIYFFAYFFYIKVDIWAIGIIKCATLS